MDYDPLALNDLAAPFLGPGFYYKTLMWPRGFWTKLYDLVIRGAAGPGALAVLVDATGRGILETGRATFGASFVPVAIAEMGAGAGKGFALQRFMTSHAANEERGAPMDEAGLWYRPGYFVREGEGTWPQSCDREMRMVRGAVGAADVSTPRKIDVQRPDAGALLDFVYTGTIGSFKQGTLRYGLMRREDGFVIADGTCAPWPRAFLSGPRPVLRRAKWCATWGLCGRFCGRSMAPVSRR